MHARTTGICVVVSARIFTRKRTIFNPGTWSQYLLRNTVLVLVKIGADTTAQIPVPSTGVVVSAPILLVPIPGTGICFMVLARILQVRVQYLNLLPAIGTNTRYWYWYRYQCIPTKNVCGGTV